MNDFRHRVQAFKPGLSAVLLCLLLCALWIAGGASRADVLGQSVVRCICWALLLAVALFGKLPKFHETRVPWIVVLLSALLVALQLVPLPPVLWQALPGHALFAEAAAASSQPQPWRPLSISPDNTLNALSSLIVPAATLLLVTCLKRGENAMLPGMLLGLIAAAALMGLLQITGSGFSNPLVNEVGGQISGPFANRNHFALFLAIGCLIAPVWPFWADRRPGWRIPVALGLILLLPLMILASGSRAGLILSVPALCIGILLARNGIRRELRLASRWAFPALIGGILLAIGTLVLASVTANRAASIERILTVDPMQDMRSRALPEVLSMIGTYFPFGSGFGTFDQAFRIAEPFSLLKLSYFNHAHNDFLEIPLNGGIPAALLLGGALIWWAYASILVWRAGEANSGRTAGRLGSAILFLVLVASAFDYPARTPLVMATIAIAAAWLARGVHKRQPAPSFTRQ